MLQTLNQGAWKSMENTWKTALQAGKKVEVDIKVIYEGTSKRPKKFEITYKVNDDTFEREFFN
ncbi:DNA/RNA non-specific endonuclease [Runella sp.]|uniref:DNA/RNA non-specific endonuclease n=1 Tax=Runella sp. TaxID=1960881 RepID=UPI003D13B960